MTEENTLKNTNVIISLSEEEERDQISEMIRKAGAENVYFAENALDLVLFAMKYDEIIVITEEKKNVFDLADTLKYIADRSKYSTISVISDSWSVESRDLLLGSVDVFLTRPVTERSLMPSMLVVTARKKHMRDLEQEYQEAEESFARDKNMSFAEHVIMDTLGLSKEGAGEYIKTLAEKHGFDEGEVAKIVYEVLLAGGKK